MTTIDEVNEKYLASDTSNTNQYCDGLRVDTKEELKINLTEIQDNCDASTAFQVWYDNQFNGIEL